MFFLDSKVVDVWQKLELRVSDQAEQIHCDLSGKVEGLKRQHAQEIEELEHEHKQATEILGLEIRKVSNDCKRIAREHDAALQREITLNGDVEKPKKSLKTQKDAYEKKLAGKCMFDSYCVSEYSS